MKLKGFTIVSLILLAILTLGAVNAADNVTDNDLTLVGESEDFSISSPQDEISVLNLSEDVSDNAINKLGASNNNLIGDNEKIITPDNISQFDSVVEKGNYTFIGDFNRSSEYLSFESGCRIDAVQARFIDMGIVLSGDVQIKGLKISATNFNEFFEDALIHVTGDDNILENLNVEYAPDSGHDVYAILFSSANDFQLLNSTINFTGSSLSKNYEYAMKIVGCNGGLIQSNTIQANLPILDVDYDKGDPGLATDLALNTGIKESENIDITGNTFIANVVSRFGSFPTLDCVLLESCNNINILNNTFNESDFITPKNNTNYLYALDMYYSSHILVKGNNVSVETDGGSLEAGTAYPIQITGPYEDVLIDSNNIYARSGGPALGIYSQNFYGDTEILVQNNNIDVAGLSSLKSWGLVSGIELQDNKARVYNNTIKTKSVTGNYEEGMKLFGISYAQELNDNHNYDIQSNTIETEGQYAIYLLKAENTTVADNYLVSSAGVGDQAIYIVNASGNTVIRNNRPSQSSENVVTSSNFDDFFDDEGILKDDIEFDELIFKGQFNALRESLYITRAVTITGEDAVLNNMAINILSDDVKLDKLTFIADTNLGNLISTDSNDIDLSNLNISYSSGSKEAIAIYIHDCADIRLVNSTIFFESHVRDDSRKSSAVQAVNTKNVLIDLNNFTTRLPAISVNEYDEDYYMMGSTNVVPLRLRDCNNLVFTRNNIDSTTNELIAEFPTIQSIYIIGCSDSLMDHNNFSMIDKVTPLGRDNYMYGISFGYNVNVTFSNNNFLMITSGGKEAAGTDYAFQGVESAVIIKANNIVSRSNGPNLGIYVASMSGGDSRLLIEDNIINVTGFSSAKGSWALVSGIEIQNGHAQIYNNTIYSQNVNSYDENAYIYGISYAQWMYGDRSFDIKDNLIYTDGKYAVSVINATNLNVEDNELYAHELTGDDSVNFGACGNVSIKNNNHAKHNILIDVNDCWFGDDNQVNITVVNATGNITIKVNGKETASEQIDSTISYTIQAADIVMGKNTIEVIYDGTESKSASFIAFDSASVIEINVGVTTIGQDVAVTVSIPGATGNVTVIVDGKEYLIELKEGTAKHTIENVTSGKHDIVAVYFGDGKKLPALNSTVFSVDKLTPLCIIPAVGLQYAKSPFTIKVRNETAVNVTVNGKQYELINGIIDIEDGLDVGEYSVLVTSPETDKYYAHSTVSTFKVIKQASNIESVNVPEVDVIAGMNVTINVTMGSEETGDVLIAINGINYTAAITDKIAVLNVNLPAGDYEVAVTYLGDDKYNASATRNVKFCVVDKINSDIAITVPGDTEKGQNVTIDISIANATGNISVIVDGIESEVSLTNGSCSVDILNVSAGNHGVVVIYSGDDIHKSAYKTAYFNVTNNPVSPKEHVNPNIDLSDVKVGESVTVNVNLPADATGNVTVFVDGLKVAAENLTEGNASFSLGVLAAGNHIVEVRYSGNVKYDSSSETKEFSVYKMTSEVKASPVEITEGETATIIVNVDCGAEGVVLVDIGGKHFYAIIDSGNASVKVIGLAADNYTANITYTGDDSYNEAFTTVNVKVNCKAAEKIGSMILISEVSGNNIYAILKDINGNSIANASVDYVINGTNFSAVTSPDGSFVIEGQNGVKTSISYAGNENLSSFETSFTLNEAVLLRSATEIKSEDYTTYAIDYDVGERGNYFKVRLVDADGNHLADKKVKIGFNGIVYNKTTDASGWAQLQINLKKAGTYTFAIAFLGDENYNASFTVNKIIVNKKTASISASAKSYKASAKSKSYTVTLKTDKGSSIDGKTYLKAGKKVTLKINGKTYTAKTDSKGKVTFALKITKKGKFAASIKYAGDSMYQSASKSVFITIK